MLEPNCMFKTNRLVWTYITAVTSPPVWPCADCFTSILAKTIELQIENKSNYVFNVFQFNSAFERDFEGKTMGSDLEQDNWTSRFLIFPLS